MYVIGLDKNRARLGAVRQEKGSVSVRSASGSLCFLFVADTRIEGKGSMRKMRNGK